LPARILVVDDDSLTGELICEILRSASMDASFLISSTEGGVEFFLFKPVERNKLLKLIRVTAGPIESERRRFTRVQLRCRVSLESRNDRPVVKYNLRAIRRGKKVGSLSLSDTR